MPQSLRAQLWTMRTLLMPPSTQLYPNANPHHTGNIHEMYSDSETQEITDEVSMYSPLPDSLSMRVSPQLLKGWLKYTLTSLKERAEFSPNGSPKATTKAIPKLTTKATPKTACKSTKKPVIYDHIESECESLLSRNHRPGRYEVMMTQLLKVILKPLSCHAR